MSEPVIRRWNQVDAIHSRGSSHTLRELNHRRSTVAPTNDSCGRGREDGNGFVDWLLAEGESRRSRRRELCSRCEV
jgi:hypothetical protein